MARLAESVAVLRRLLDGETVDFAGEHYHLTGASCDPRPVQDHVPLLVGGGGRRMLAIAARLADTVGFTGLGRTLEDGQHHEATGFAPSRVDEQVAWARSVAGERLGQIELQVLVQAVVVTDDPEVAAEDIVGRIPGLAPDDALSTPYLLVGTAQGMVERLLAQRERWGFSHYTVRPPAMDAFAPVMAALAGK